MNAQETVFNILREIRSATEYLSAGRPISALDMVRITEIHTHLLELTGGYSDILFSQLNTEVDNTSKLNEIYKKVVDECNAYNSVYLPKRDEWDRLCSWKGIITLVTSKAREEFALRIHCANEEKNKWQVIYEKYNNITRLYYSMDCRPDDKERDMMIINKYREELYDLVGHPISLDTIDVEHDKAKQVVKAKWDALGEIHKQEQRRAGELQEQIRGNVLFYIHSIVTEIISLLPTTLKDTFPNAEGIKKKGRPNNETVYERVGIYDLKTCFIKESTYNKVIGIIQNYQNKITGDFINSLFKVLTEKSLLNIRMKSCSDFAEYMRKDPLINGFITFSSTQALYPSKNTDNNYDFWKSQL